MAQAIMAPIADPESGTLLMPGNSTHLFGGITTISAYEIIMLEKVIINNKYIYRKSFIVCISYSNVLFLFWK